MPANSEGVTIQLDGSPVLLRYTLGASKKIDAHFGDFVKAYQRVIALNFGACVLVVALGLGKEAAEVEEAVFRSGISTLAPDLSSYLSWLGNGGRDPTLNTDTTEKDSGNV